MANCRGQPAPVILTVGKQTARMTAWRGTGRGAPRSVEQGAASVLFGVTTTETGAVFRDGKKIPP